MFQYNNRVTYYHLQKPDFLRALLNDLEVIEKDRTTAQAFWDNHHNVGKEALSQKDRAELENFLNQINWNSYFKASQEMRKGKDGSTQMILKPELEALVISFRQATTRQNPKLYNWLVYCADALAHNEPERINLHWGYQAPAHEVFGHPPYNDLPPVIHQVRAQLQDQELIKHQSTQASKHRPRVKMF